MGSPSPTESRERCIWLFLDEFPQLPPVRQFPASLELGHSKGVVVVIGAQNIVQLRAAYGAEQAKSWIGMIGTKIITQINVGEAAEEAKTQACDVPHPAFTKAGTDVAPGRSRRRKTISPARTAKPMELIHTQS